MSKTELRQDTLIAAGVPEFAAKRHVKRAERKAAKRASHKQQKWVYDAIEAQNRDWRINIEIAQLAAFYRRLIRDIAEGIMRDELMREVPS